MEKVVRETRNTLHESIIVRIFLWLPLNSITRFKCASKRWFSFISTPCFRHLRYSVREAEGHARVLSLGNDARELYVNSIEGELLGRIPITGLVHRPQPGAMALPCDGLICLSDGDDIVVCNTTTEELASIPRGSLHQSRFRDMDPWWREYDPPLLGLGFDSIPKKHKLVRIFVHQGDYGPADFRQECEVYTLGSTSWRQIGAVPFYLSRCSSSAFVNGALHWMISQGLHVQLHQIISHRHDGYQISMAIISFDLHDEKFRVISHPPCCSVRDMSYHRMFLVEMEGSLCVTDHVNALVDIWMLKSYRDGTWVKQYSIDTSSLGYIRYVRPLGRHKGGKICLKLRYADYELHDYDPETETLEKLGNCPQLPSDCTVLCLLGLLRRCSLLQQ